MQKSSHWETSQESDVQGMSWTQSLRGLCVCPAMAGVNIVAVHTSLDLLLFLCVVRNVTLQAPLKEYLLLNSVHCPCFVFYSPSSLAYFDVLL